MLKKDAAGKWVGSNPDAALEYSAEVNMSHSDRIDIAVECGEDEMYRTVATRKEGPLFVDVDLTRTYVNNHVTTVLISGSEKLSVVREQQVCLYCDSLRRCNRTASKCDVRLRRSESLRIAAGVGVGTGKCGGDSAAGGERDSRDMARPRSSPLERERQLGGRGP